MEADDSRSSESRSDARHFALDNLADSFWVAGTVLYWGEGSKTTRRLELANADPAGSPAIHGLDHDGISTPTPAFAAALNLHANNDEQVALLSWQRDLGLSRDDFTRSYIKPDGTGHRKNHLPHGVCRVRLRRGTDAFLKTMVWVDGSCRADGIPTPPSPGLTCSTGR